MKTKLKTLCLLITTSLFYFTQFTLAQSNDLLSAKKGRLYTIDGYEIKFRSITEDGDHFLFKNKRKARVHIKKSDVLRIEKQTGSEAWKYGKLNTVVGSLTATFLIYVYRENNLYSNIFESRRNQVFYIAGSGIVGGMIGLLIGGSQKKYKKIYDDQALKDIIKNSKNPFRFKLGILNNTPTFHLSLKIN